MCKLNWRGSVVCHLEAHTACGSVKNCYSKCIFFIWTSISCWYFTQYFVEAPLAAITASRLLGYDSTSLEHLYLGSFSHSSLQILSSSVKLDGEYCCTAIFRSLQRYLIWFKSGLLLGHSWTFRDLSQSHSWVVLAVCLGLVSCWKVTFSPVWGPERSGAGFHQGSLFTLLRSSFAD